MPKARKSIPYYERDRRRGVAYSLGLHLILLALAIFGLPSFLTPRPPAEPMVMTVEILPISAMSNVKPSQQQPAERKPEEPKPTPKAPPVKVAEEAPPPPPQQPSIMPKPQQQPKPKQAEPKKPKPKPKSDDFALLMSKLANEKKNDPKKNADDSASKSKSDNYNPSLPMSLSEMDAIRNQIAKCWNVPAGAKNAHELVVTLRLQLASDGSVLRVDMSSETAAKASGDPFFRAAADSARRAVQECSPLKNLPQDKYATWRDIEMTFDPKQMLF